MTGLVQIVRCHVDFEGRQIVVQFRRYDEATKTYLPLPPNLSRHILPMNQELLDAIDHDVRPMLERDLGEVTDAHPAAVTSALHHLREVRHETAFLRRQAAADVAEAEARVSKAKEEHAQVMEQVREAERLRAVAEEATDVFLRKNPSTAR